MDHFAHRDQVKRPPFNFLLVLLLLVLAVAASSCEEWFEGDDDNRNRRYDQYPNYRGKGPKVYARSADRIL